MRKLMTLLVAVAIFAAAVSPALAADLGYTSDTQPIVTSNNDSYENQQFNQLQRQINATNARIARLENRVQALEQRPQIGTPSQVILQPIQTPALPAANDNGELVQRIFTLEQNYNALAEKTQRIAVDLHWLGQQVVKVFAKLRLSF